MSLHKLVTINFDTKTGLSIPTNKTGNIKNIQKLVTSQGTRYRSIYNMIQADFPIPGTVDPPLPYPYMQGNPML